MSVIDRFLDRKVTGSLSVSDLKKRLPDVYAANERKFKALAKKGTSTVRIKHAGEWLTVTVEGE